MRPKGSQFDSFGPRPNKLLALMDINKAEGVFDASNVFKATGIRAWPVDSAAHEYGAGTGLKGSYGSVYGEESTLENIDTGETLHTRQKHLHGPTMRKYMAEGPPEMDDLAEEYGTDEPWEVPYAPEVAIDRHNNKWIGEGHHRIATARLNGQDIDAYTGYRRDY